jgi:hypothetical protein
MLIHTFFCKAIKTNGEKNDVNIVNLICFTLHNAILEWGENFMRAHPICRFKEIEVMFYKHYCKILMDEQVYMALLVITQGRDGKVEIYHERILKLANYL